MKFATLLIVLTLNITSGFSQDANFPFGIYKTFKEIKQKNPSVLTELNIERRTASEIKMNGGNDYKLSPLDKSIKKSTIKWKYFAYSDGMTLYINGGILGIQPWYTPILSDGKFLIIKGGISNDQNIRKEQLKNINQIGNAFGAIGGGIQGAKSALLKFIYVVDKESNRIDYVSVEYLRELLKNDEELLQKFENEENQEDQEIQLKYLKKINEN